MSTVLKEVTRKMQEKVSPALVSSAAMRDGDGKTSSLCFNCVLTFLSTYYSFFLHLINFYCWILGLFPVIFIANFPVFYLPPIMRFDLMR